VTLRRLSASAAMITAVVLAASLASCGGGAKRHKAAAVTATSTTSTAQPPTTRPPVQVSQPGVPQEIMTAHALPDGQLDVEGALELFSYAFAPLPGVTLPPGAQGVPGDWTDTAVDAIVPHMAELTAGQRRVVLSFLAANQPTSSPTASTVAAGPTSAAGRARFMSYTAQLIAATAQAQIEVRVQQAVQDEAKQLGHTLSDVGASNSAVHVVLANVEDQSEGSRPGRGRGGRAARP
jgi:hypothetical protein